MSPSSIITGKMALLRYPALPEVVLEKILQKKAGEPRVFKQQSSLSQLWGLKNIGFFEVYNQSLQPASNSILPCSSKVVVAVIDTGIDYTHPELRDNLWINRGETGFWQPPKGSTTECRQRSCNGIDDDDNGFADDVVGWDFVHNVPLPYDTHGHGTHIAGIIAGEALGGAPIAGVCLNVLVMALKYYDNSGIGYNNLQNTVRAVQYAVRNGAHIINYSGGGSDPAPSERAAIEEARLKNVLFVAAAGNDSHNNDVIPYFPASYGLENIIVVASLNQQNELLSSSNFGPKSVHVAAPGLTIFSALPRGRFGTMSGTSQATAFVTGAAALLISQVDLKNYDHRKIKHWLEQSSGPISGKKDRLSGGIISIAKALKLQREETQMPVGAPTPEVAVKGQ